MVRGRGCPGPLEDVGLWKDFSRGITGSNVAFEWEHSGAAVLGTINKYRTTLTLILLLLRQASVLIQSASRWQRGKREGG